MVGQFDLAAMAGKLITEFVLIYLSCVTSHVLFSNLLGGNVICSIFYEEFCPKGQWFCYWESRFYLTIILLLWLGLFDRIKSISVFG